MFELNSELLLSRHSQEALWVSWFFFAHPLQFVDKKENTKKNQLYQRHILGNAGSCKTSVHAAT